MLCNFSFFSYLFFKINFFQKLYQEHYLSSSLEPDQDMHCVGLDLGLSFLQGYQ